ncbi:MAG: Ig-like domain-containing protein [Candidatus Roizmanbacteria bacterium]|nr:Ig-like domain-containing protein [Candidatus Roizmanbacteria bacterium]
MKIKILIVSLASIAILLAILFFWSKSNLTQNEKGMAQRPILPTGITIPTETITTDELDIVAVPDDGSTNVPLKKALKLTFSQKFTNADIEFYIGPNTPYLSNIEDNVLIVAPQTQWDEGVVYTFSIIFPDDKEKIRTYKFQTVGSPQQKSPNTRPEGLYEQQEQFHKENYPDIYVTNQTPYENDIFAIRAEFDSTPPGHFYFIITSKINDQERLSQEVNVWLQSLDLTQDQINRLDIRY